AKGGQADWREKIKRLDYARERDSEPGTAPTPAVCHGRALQTLLRDQRPVSQVDVLGSVWGAEGVRSWRFLSRPGVGWRSMGCAVLAGQKPYWLVVGWCPRQDSNLRSRLRRLLPCTALTSVNALSRVLPGRVSGATRGTGRRALWTGVVPVSLEAQRPASGPRFGWTVCRADTVERDDNQAGQRVGESRGT